MLKDEEDFNEHEEILNKKLTAEEHTAIEGTFEEKKKVKITPEVKQKLLQKFDIEQIDELKKTDYHHILFLKQFTPEERKIIYQLCLGERLNKTEAVVYTGIQKKLKESAYDKNFVTDVYCDNIERESIQACLTLSDIEIEILAILVRKKLLSNE